MGKDPSGSTSSSETTSRLELRLLGQVAATLDGRRISALTSARVQRALTRIVLARGRPLSRSLLAYELWPDSTETQAHTNLRKVLHEIRSALPEAERYVHIDTHEVAWRPEAAAVDVIAFCEAIDQRQDALAASFYGGDLLPSCWDDWVIAERERLRGDATAALDRLARAALERGDDVSAMDHSQAVLEIDPLWEAGYRHLMRAHTGLGNRAEALRTYHRCAERLQSELGVEPDAETRLIHQELTRHDDPSDAHESCTPSSGTLIGRDGVLDQLATDWQRVRAGAAHLVVVTGEPGVGKTRLIDELVRSLEPSTAVARSRSYEAASRLPWGPVVDWLRTPAVRDAIGGLESGWRDELALLLPELRRDEGRPGDPRWVRVDPSQRRQLFDAVAEALLAVSRPLVLVVDDLQWCDADTIDLIGHVLAGHPEAPMMVAGTARTGDIDDDHPLAALTASLTLRRSISEIELGPLDAEATAALARELVGRRLSSETTEQLWRDTGGNPLFVVESVRAGLPTRPGDRGPLTPNIKAAIGSRLRTLSDRARAVIEIAATIGREFSTDLLMAALELDESETVDALDELWRRRIIAEHGTDYDFTHDKVREVAYETISPVRRRRHHHAVARALSTVHGPGPGPQSSLLAAHWELAGRMPEAVGANLEASEYALSVSALDQAIASSTQGLGHLEQMAPGPERDASELELRLALGAPMVAREGYGSARARDVYERALALCSRLGRSPDPAVLRGLGLGAVMACRFDRSTHFGEQLLAVSEDPVATTEGHYLIGVSSFWRGDLAAARHHLEAGLASYAPEHGPTHRAYFAQDPYPVCLVRLALTLLWQGELEQARSETLRARESATSLDHPTTLGYVLMYTSIVAAELEDVDALRSEVAAGATLWAEQELGYFITLGQLFEAWLGVLDDRPAALDGLQAIVDRWHDESESLHLTYGLGLLARARLRVGDIEGGLSAAREGLSWGSDHGQRYAESLLRRIEGDLLAARDDRAGAHTAYTSAVDVAREQGARWLQRLAEGRLAALATGT